MPARWLDDADHRDCFQTEFTHGHARRAELRLAAVDHDQIRQRFSFFKQTSIPPRYDLMHGREVVRAFNAPDAKLAILGPVHATVVANDHARDVLRTLDVRDVKPFDSRRKVRQLESLLKLFEHTFHIGFQNAESLFESVLRVLVDEVDHVALLTALRIVDSHATPLAFRQCFLQQLAIVKVYGDVDLARHVIGGVILRQHFAQKLRRIEIVFRQILPEKLAPPDDVSFAHREQLQREPLSFAVVTKDVDVAFRSRGHLLLLGKPDHGLAQIAILRRELVTHVVRRFEHPRFEHVGELFVATFEQQSYVAHRFLILFGRAETFDAWSETAFDVILETGTRRSAVDLDVAGA